MAKIQFTAADLLPLKEALLTGATSITVEGQSVNFRSQEQIQRLISEIEASIAQTENPAAVPVSANTIVGSFSKYPRRSRE